MNTAALRWFCAPAWLLLLAALPWWLGLPMLLAIMATLLLASDRLHDEARRLRLAVRWGLPGVLFAVQRALGGDAFAWAMALLGALVGYTLLAGVEAWLDRGLRAPMAEPESRDWSALALAPIGPAAALIELQPPEWSEGTRPDPRGGEVRWEPGRFRFADGTVVERVEARASISPDGRWFVARTARGIVVLDRDRRRSSRLRGWKLCGWHDGPWLTRGAGPAMVWQEVVGRRGA